MSTARKLPPIPRTAPKQEFHIAFDTRVNPGYIAAVKVTIELDMLPGDDTKYSIGLADHPLYRWLQQYVLSNQRKMG